MQVDQNVDQKVLMSLISNIFQEIATVYYFSIAIIQVEVKIMCNDITSNSVIVSSLLFLSSFSPDALHYI